MSVPYVDSKNQKGDREEEEGMAKKNLYLGATVCNCGCGDIDEYALHTTKEGWKKEGWPDCKFTFCRSEFEKATGIVLEPGQLVKLDISVTPVSGGKKKDANKKK